MNSENPDVNHGKEEEEEEEEEALRLKTLAGSKFNSCDLDSALNYITKAHSLSPSLYGVSEMLTSFTILQQAAASSYSSPTSQSAFPNYYSILQVQPFSHIDTIKKQYKKLALTLHPDKNPNLGSEEAFKVVTEGFKVLSDKVRRKEYDLKLRIRLQEESVVGGGGGGVEEEERFSTVCPGCQLVHKFEKKFLGHNLVCPKCRKSFRAVDVEEGDGDRSGGGGGEEVSGDECRVKVKDGRSRGMEGGIEHAEVGEEMGSKERVENVKLKVKVVVSDGSAGDKASSSGGEWGGGRLRGKMNKVRELMEILYKKRVNVGDDTMTLAEMQSAVKRKSNVEKVKLKEKEKHRDTEKKEREKEKEKHRDLEKKGKEVEKKGKEKEKVEKKGKEKEMDVENKMKEKGKQNERKNDSGKDSESEGGRLSEMSQNMQLDIEMRRPSKRKFICLESERQVDLGKNNYLEVEKYISKRKKIEYMGDKMVVPVHTDFYNFRREITERSFKNGQVWAIYDEVDGFPRHYGVINDVIATNPFVLRLSWLELQDSAYEEESGLHVGCGIFRVSRETLVKSVSIFSHLVDCERAARDVYRIYPKKGSIWAVYKESDGSNTNCYDLIVFLTTYSDTRVLSFGDLEKVDGFKTIFKRREIGCHAVQYLNNDELQICSHQIPAKKLCGNEDPKLVEECWELDPASLPSNLLNF